MDQVSSEPGKDSRLDLTDQMQRAFEAAKLEGQSFHNDTEIMKNAQNIIHDAQNGMVIVTKR